MQRHCRITIQLSGLLLFSLTAICNLRATPQAIIIDDRYTYNCLQDHGKFLALSNSNRYEEGEILNKIDSFKSWDDMSLNYSVSELWMHFTVTNQTSKNQKIFLNGQNIDFIDLYRIESNKLVKLSGSGFLVDFASRPSTDWGTIIHTEIDTKITSNYLVRFKSVTKNSKGLIDYVTKPCIKLYNEKSYEASYKLPKSLVYLFFGALVMMALYNLGISLSSMYREYMLFSVYNIACLLAGVFFTGLHLELGLVKNYDFIRNVQYIIGSLIFPSYIWFSIKFLDLKEKDNSLFKSLRIITWGYFPILACILLSFFYWAFIQFSVLLGSALILVLISSMRQARKDTSARFLFIGNLLISTAGFLQLLNLLNVIPTNTLTIGIIMLHIAEILVFSFAVALKLKTSRRALLNMRHQNQIQKERLNMEATIRHKLQMENDQKSRALITSSIQLLNLNQQISDVEKNIKEKLTPIDHKLSKKLINQLEDLREFDDQWSHIKMHFEEVHPEFFSHLEQNFPALSQNDQRMCAFMKMKFSNKEIATILNVTTKAVEQTKRRMRKKLYLEPEQDILRHIEIQTEHDLSTNI